MGFFFMSRFQIFKSGTRTDHNGNTVTITDADVEQAAAAYDPKLNQAPIVIGHPTTNAPAYGWISGLSADKGVLCAEFSQVDDNFAELVRAGRYKKVSASFYPPEHPANPKSGVWYLRHVGFLGAAAPAVKGLQPINFCDDTAGIVEFSEEVERDAADSGLLRRLLRLLSFAENFKPEDASSVSPTQVQESVMTITPEQLAAEKAAREKAEAEAAQAQAELKKLKEQQEREQREAAHKENADFAEGLVKSGSLKPADKDLMVQVLDFVQNPTHTTADFGEGSTKKPLATAIREFLQALPKQFPAGEVATRPSATADFAEGMTHHERALALMKQENISYEAAARRTA